MKRLSALIVICLLMLPAASFGQTKLGIGFMAGVDIPVIQEDQESGSVFGFKGRWQFVPGLTLDPYISFSSWGDATVDDLNATLAGSDVTAFGVDLTLGNALGRTGVLPYFTIGLGFYKISNDQYGDIFEEQGSRLGLSGGLGIGAGLSPAIALNVGSKLHVITQEDGGSRKSITIAGGITYAFGSN